MEERHKETESLEQHICDSGLPGRKSKRIICHCRHCKSLKVVGICRAVSMLGTVALVTALFKLTLENWDLFLEGIAAGNCQAPSSSFTGGILSLRTESLALASTLLSLLYLVASRVREGLWIRNPAHHLLLANRIQKICCRLLATILAASIGSVMFSGARDIPTILESGAAAEGHALLDLIFHSGITVTFMGMLTSLVWRLTDIYLISFIGFKYKMDAAEIYSTEFHQWLQDCRRERKIVRTWIRGSKLGVILVSVAITWTVCTIFDVKGKEIPSECWDFDRSPWFPCTLIVLATLLICAECEWFIGVTLARGQVEDVPAQVIEPFAGMVEGPKKIL